MGYPRVYDMMKFEPIVLKQLVLDCGLSQTELALYAGVSRAAVNLAVNRGYLPKRVEAFKAKIEQLIKENAKAAKWLSARGLQAPEVWKQLKHETKRGSSASSQQRAWDTRRIKAMIPADPTGQGKIKKVEVEMIREETKRHFKLFKNPFIDDVLEDKDIYMSDEHRYIEAAMLDAARHGGFLAVIGECQSGKSIMRRKMVLQLQREGNVRIIFPQIVDKDRATAASICDAIISDISSEKSKVRLEQLSRQVHRLLLSRHKQGYRHCLIIEEAHDLDLKILKLLKRFYEMEDGYTKLLGIILIGQTELKERLDEEKHPDMREVIRRVQKAEILGLNGNIKGYLELKFKRVGAKIEDIITDEAVKALGLRLSTKDGKNGKAISHAYPGLVNNYMAKAMNMACDMGEAKVTEEAVGAI